MRTLLHFVCLLILGMSFDAALAQQGAIEGKYDRIGFSYILLPESGKINVFGQKKPDLYMPEKFDFNEIQQLYLTNISPQADGSFDQGQIMVNLYRQGVGRELMGFLFNRDAKGYMNLERIMERGVNNANRSNYEEAKALKRDEAYLRDMGFDLIAKTYIMVIQVQAVRTSANDKTRRELNSLLNTEEVGFVVDGKVLLYKLDINQQDIDQFFAEYYVGSASEANAAQKIGKWKNYDPKFVLIGEETFQALNVDNEVAGKTDAYKKSVEKQLLNGLPKVVTQAATEAITLKVDALAVKDQITRTLPIRSNIGRKEGLKLGDRYFVYENRLLANGQTTSSRVGTVRVTQVGENRQEAGYRSASSFKQVHGKSIKTGMTLREKKDLGIGAALGYQFGEFNAAFARIEVPVHGYFTRIFIEGGLGFETARLGGQRPDNEVQYLLDMLPELAGLKDYMFTRYNAGIQYDWHFARSFFISPQVSIGFENAKLVSFEIDEEFSISSIFLQGGITAGVALSPSLHLFGRLTYTTHTADPTVEFDEEDYSTTGLYYENIFITRSNYIAFGTGFRLIF